MKYVEVEAAKEYANAVMADPILKAAVNSILDNAPGADIAPVVRCKDCAKYNAEFGRCTDPRNGKGCYGAIVPENHYCGYGERKGNDGKTE